MRYFNVVLRTAGDWENDRQEKLVKMYFEGVWELEKMEAVSKIKDVA